jgi:hypothetical protein
MFTESVDYQVQESSKSDLDINNVRSHPKRQEDVGSLPSLIGIWLLIPFALGGFAYIVTGLIHLAIDPELLAPRSFYISWLIVTLLLQVAFWIYMANKSGRKFYFGLWALIPFIALVPTLKIAKDLASKSDEFFLS